MDFVAAKGEANLPESFEVIHRAGSRLQQHPPLAALPHQDVLLIGIKLSQCHQLLCLHKTVSGSMKVPHVGR